MKKILAMLLVLAMALSLVACGGEEKAPETTAAPAAQAPETAPAETEAEIVPQTLKVMWWGNQSRADSTMAMLKEFEALHPGLTVEVEFTNWDGYFDKLSTLAISNNMPDVIQMDISRVYTYTESDLLAELDSYVASGALDLSQCNQGILNTGKVDGVTYAVPTGVNTRALIYRKDVVEQAGVEIPMEPTWDELIEICKTVYEKTGWTSVLCGEENYFDYSLRNFGLSWFNEDQSALGFDDPQLLVDFWTRYLTAVDDGYGLHLSKKTRTSDAETFIKDSWIAMAWTNQVAGYVENSGGVEIGFCQMPEEPNAVAPSNYMQPTMLWSVPAGAKNPDMAVEFINWFTNEQTPFDIASTDRGVPINADMSAYVSTKLEGVAAQAAEFVSWLSTEGKVADLPVDKNPKAAEVKTSLFVEYSEGVKLGSIKDLEKAAIDFMAAANALLAEGVA